MPTFYDIPTDEIAPDDSWVAGALAASTIPNVIGLLTSDDVQTGDAAIDIQLVVDNSGSLDGYEDYIIAGVEGIPASGTNPAQPGLYDELKKVNKTDRAKFRSQMRLFADNVRELYPLTRLFIKDPQQQGKDMRNPAIVKLSRANYRTSGSTNTILAAKRALADAMAYNAVMAHPDFEVTTKHVLALMTDGFCNQGTVGELIEVRKTINKLRKQENWTFLFFCVADIDTVKSYRQQMARVSDVAWYIEKLIKDHAFIDDEQPSPVTGKKYTAEEKAFAQLLFETMGTGWGFYAETEKEVKAMTGENGRIAQLYLASEGKLVDMLSGFYTAKGGFAFPAQNVTTIFFEPLEIARMLGQKVSSSVIRSVGLSAGPASPAITPSVNAPTGTSPSAPASTEEEDW